MNYGSFKVILHFYITFYLANGSVWHKDWPHKVYAGQWSIFRGPVILPYILIVNCKLFW